MPANIATTNGRPAFAFYGEEPWHKLGQQLDAPATAEEAVIAAGLDYEVALTDVAMVDGLMVPNTKVVVRYDSQTVLGVVSDKYAPCQNRQAFGFLDALVADGGLRYHTAGALGLGEKIFLLAKLPGHPEAERATNRLRSTWWGTAAKGKEQAWDAALELAA